MKTQDQDGPFICQPRETHLTSMILGFCFFLSEQQKVIIYLHYKGVVRLKIMHEKCFILRISPIKYNYYSYCFFKYHIPVLEGNCSTFDKQIFSIIPLV